jgi:hypothetical protein
VSAATGAPPGPSLEALVDALAGADAWVREQPTGHLDVELRRGVLTPDLVRQLLVHKAVLLTRLAADPLGRCGLGGCEAPARFWWLGGTAAVGLPLCEAHRPARAGRQPYSGPWLSWVRPAWTPAWLLRSAAGRSRAPP